MHVFTRLSVCSVLASSVFGVCSGQDIADVDAADIDAMFAKWDRSDCPGLAVGVFVEGMAVHTSGYGMANLDEGIPISPDSVFCTYSVAKSFTTACIAILLDEGRISLDDDIRQHLPELPRYDNVIRIRHLLRCRSGLQDYLHALMLSGRELSDVFTKEDVFDMICRQKSTPISPGEKFHYSNTDYFLLGLIVERVSGESLRSFADRRIFSPLGMQSTFFDDDRSQLLKNRVLGYGRRADDSYHCIGMYSSTVGPLGLKTTVADLLKWDRNFRDDRLSDGPHLREFFSTGYLIANKDCLCAYGSQRYRGLKRVCQTGGGPGFMSHFVRFPEHNLSIALLSNLSEVDQWYAMEQIVGQIAERYLAEHFTEPAKSLAWDQNPDSVQLSPDQLHRRSGGFQKPDETFVRLIVDGGALAVARFNLDQQRGPPIPLTSLSKHRFRAVDTYAPYEILFDADSPDSISVRYQDGYRQKWNRVEFVSPAREELAAYEGEYYCDNLEAVHRFSVENEQLSVQFNNGRRHRLIPATTDLFIPATRRIDNMQFEFSRDASDGVDAFKVTFERVYHRFERR